jgi:hypothetical protein
MTKQKLLFAGFSLACSMAPSGGAQILQSLPNVAGVTDRIGPIGPVLDSLPKRAAQTLADARIERVAALVRANPDRIMLDPNGFPARAGELLLDDPDDQVLTSAARQGFRIIEHGDVLGVRFVRVAIPPGQSLSKGIRTLKQLGAKSVAADQLHAESGFSGLASAPSPGSNPASGTGPAIGIIDGGVAGRVTAQRGFATGAPHPGNHGSAIASLIAGRGPVRGALPSARIFAADVYGTDPAGGNASAIAKAIGWLVGEGVPVLTISLTGPANPVLARVVAAAQTRGTIIVAAVGNDGPASPLSYPASYPGVIAVTGVDDRNRVLIEAGRATHLDYAAPGADMLAANASGVGVAVRGSSFAAPLVAARTAAAYPTPDPARRRAAISVVDAGARKLGSRYGRGIVCAECRTPIK